MLVGKDTILIVVFVNLMWSTVKDQPVSAEKRKRLWKTMLNNSNNANTLGVLLVGNCQVLKSTDGYSIQYSGVIRDNMLLFDWALKDKSPIRALMAGKWLCLDTLSWSIIY